MRSDKQRIQEILTQTIVSLCNSGLSFETELSVEGLLGITLDKADVFLVNINEVVSLAQSAQETSITSSVCGNSPTRQQQTQPQSLRHGFKRRRMEDDDVLLQQTMSPSLKSQQYADISQGLSLPFKQEPSVRTSTVSSTPGLTSSPQAMSVSGLHRRSMSLETGYLAGSMMSPPPPSHSLSRSHSQSSSDGHSVPSDNPSRPVSVDSDVVVKEEPQDFLSSGAGPGSEVDPAEAGSRKLPRTADHGFDHAGSGTLPQSPGHGVPASSAVDRRMAYSSQQQLPGASMNTGVNIHTVRAYQRDVRRVTEWLAQVKAEHRPMHHIPLHLLNQYFCEMWTSIRKRNGQPYEFSSLQQMRSMVDRHLRVHTHGQVNLSLMEFFTSNVVHAKLREAAKLKKQPWGTLAMETGKEQGTLQTLSVPMEEKNTSTTPAGSPAKAQPTSTDSSRHSGP